MSGDFDAALERLVTDPEFAAALAADPAAALAGYRLSADEWALLQTQVSTDTGGQRAVETRTNQSSVFGMLSPLAGVVGLGIGYGAGGHESFGPAGHGSFGPAGGGQGASFGPADGGQGASFGPADGGQGASFGPAGASGQGTLGGASGGSPPPAYQGDSSVGEAIRATWSEGTAGVGDPMPDMAFGPAAEVGVGTFGAAVEPQTQPGPGEYLAPPEDYHIRVDVDGDGRWDRHILQGRADGGVDILADMNRDGRVDFIGHDDDADGLVESADYDKNRDGTFEKRMFDDNGDGWLDRSVYDR